MSALGQKQTLSDFSAMSALPQKRTLALDSCMSAKCQKQTFFDQWRPTLSKLSACAPAIVDPSTLQKMALSLNLQFAGRNEMMHRRIYCPMPR
jgi:hypothetical protein